MTVYGFAACFLTSDADRMFRLADAPETGMIGTNKCGLGREGSSHGIGDYLAMKPFTISTQI